MDLYLVVVLLPEPVHGQVWELKQQVHQRTGSRNAVRLPPHITLVPPTRQPPAFAAKAAAVLRRFAAGQAPCPLELHDFAWFGQRTLYVRVLPGPVQQLHAALAAWLAQELPAVPAPTRPFVPHVTLATRDLPAEHVPGLRRDFAARTYRATCLAEQLVLFRHDGQQWVPLQHCALGAAAAA
ncbi:2'-5' RNA ligase family protein [Hymenobacter weizhouensis]|uniref:2'-5' RNA ligase family protein n=1 Tax=Hymenobacter sp. YIM 151500-1 TaxID=2987689 RepID=UPI00222775C9|nr:2'-5' RNA ligase family protein [Hymenobacter sp. YIM 151500-1]UYZ64241.1 2'-5' RNA ligase family protein [Hymenobacter sp. YIM 151500-1]